MWGKGQVFSDIRFVALKCQRLQRHLCVQPQDLAVSTLPLRPPVPSPWFQASGVLMWTGRVHRAISCLKGSWGQFLPCVRGIHFLWILRGQDVPGLCESLFSGLSLRKRCTPRLDDGFSQGALGRLILAFVSTGKTR